MDDEANNYKSKCDEVLLPRNSSARSVTFDKAMTDDEVMAVLQELINGS
ncbi:hypothetical protein PP739_gp30 [Salmonella phage LPSTLL]|uniref:Uncharacterized protein n=1 Tax=Salmonella phage LPSTLL TaxID=3071280 RepID=A0A8E3UYG0_9CAUD|nr:hypothetical protein PP739_gp30 [Salmonella phage LPSTLL]QGZ14988.1 hypothetical protein vBSalSLPSTLL_orf00030 [Salmonella phage LPSTLL]